MVGVVACSKRKLARPAPALELYRGEVFARAVAYLRALGCDRLVVLSAKHGAILGTDRVEPYELALASLSAAERRAWAARAADVLVDLVPTGARVHAIVPAPYAPALERVEHVRHFAGLPIGHLRRALRLATTEAA
jgi:hypothetical protein